MQTPLSLALAKTNESTVFLSRDTLSTNQKPAKTGGRVARTAHHFTMCLHPTVRTMELCTHDITSASTGVGACIMATTATSAQSGPSSGPGGVVTWIPQRYPGVLWPPHQLRLVSRVISERISTLYPPFINNEPVTNNVEKCTSE